MDFYSNFINQFTVVPNEQQGISAQIQYHDPYTLPEIYERYECFTQRTEIRGDTSPSGLEFMRTHKASLKYEETPSEFLITRYVCAEIDHENTDNLLAFFTNNRPLIEDYTNRFLWKYSVNWLTEIFNPYRFKARCRLNSFMQVFGVFERDVAVAALLNLNAMRINDTIEKFLLPSSDVLSYKVGISKNIAERLKKHSNDFNVLRSAVPFKGISCSEMHFLEMCGVLKLEQLHTSEQIGKCMNLSPGYDNSSILTVSGECSVYLLACIQSTEKRSKTIGKLSFRNKEFEKRNTNMFYDLFEAKNYGPSLSDITAKLKYRFRKNYTCSRTNCAEAFKTELGEWKC